MGVPMIDPVRRCPSRGACMEWLYSTTLAQGVPMPSTRSRLHYRTSYVRHRPRINPVTVASAVSIVVAMVALFGVVLNL